MQRAGVILAVEASVKNVLRTQSQLLGVLDRFPTQHLQVVCDPYNYLSSHLLDAQERATGELLTRFEDRFVLAHLKDVAAEGAEVGTPSSGPESSRNARTSSSSAIGAPISTSSWSTCRRSTSCV